MDIKTKILTLTKKTLKKMRESIDKSEIEQIQKYSYLLSEIQIISQNQESIEARLQGLENDYDLLDKGKTQINNEHVLVENTKNNLSAKAKAKIKRNEFVNLLQSEGVNLEPYKGVVYRDSKDEGLVGVAYSCDNGDSWFLGLPDLNYKAVVLLCDKEKENLNAIILPKDFYLKYKQNLSKSGNQVKFNVRSSFGKYTLYTKVGNVSVDNYRNNYKVF